MKDSMVCTVLLMYWAATHVAPYLHTMPCRHVSCVGRWKEISEGCQHVLATVLLCGKQRGSFLVHLHHCAPTAVVLEQDLEKRWEARRCARPLDLHDESQRHRKVDDDAAAAAGHRGRRGPAP